MLINKRKKLIINILIILGIFIRIFAINRFPTGLNVDEASLSYEAYGVLTTLHGRNNEFLPVYFIAWGSGQSSLLAYITIPFIKFLGLNIISTRLPMALISSLSIIVFYKIMELCFESDENKDIFVIFGTLFFVLNPWHVMKSRWGLDCNILPDIVMLGVYFLIKHFKFAKNSKHNYFLISFAIFAISAYSYATSYVGLSLMCVIIYYYGLKNKKISFKEILVSVIIVLLITWPLIIFVSINFLNIDSVQLPFLTIPRLYNNRMFNNTILGGKNPFLHILYNIYETIKLYILQDDGIYWNDIKGVGIYYLFSFPLFVVGIIDYIINKKRKTSDVTNDVFVIWLISGFILNLLHFEVNVNRCNFIFIPIIFFIIKGFCCLFKIKTIRTFSFALLIISFSIFNYKYIDSNIKKENGILIDRVNTKDIDCFVYGLEPVIIYADSLDSNNIYFISRTLEKYIYVLYYLKKDPRDYHFNHELTDQKAVFNIVKSYRNWNFYLPNNGIIRKNDVIIADLNLKNSFDRTGFDVVEIGQYVVAIKK